MLSFVILLAPLILPPLAAYAVVNAAACFPSSFLCRCLTAFSMSCPRRPCCACQPVCLPLLSVLCGCMRVVPSLYYASVDVYQSISLFLFLIYLGCSTCFTLCSASCLLPHDALRFHTVFAADIVCFLLLRQWRARGKEESRGRTALMCVSAANASSRSIRQWTRTIINWSTGIVQGTV